MDMSQYLEIFIDESKEHLQTMNEILLILEGDVENLSHLGEISGGNWVAILISIDAVLVLSGAVLTSFVGVSGLLERMTLDRILPLYFLKKNKRGSSHRIIILFLLLNISVLFITHGKVTILAGVYTISFLSVMALFAIGNAFLKIKRAKLPRPEVASWISLFVALAAVGIALFGNIRMEPAKDLPSNVSIFFEYSIPAIILVFIMLNRISFLKFLMSTIHYLSRPFIKNVKFLDNFILNIIKQINSQQFVFFTRGDNIVNLNRVMLYILNNEHTRRVKIVSVLRPGENVAENLDSDIRVISRLYPKIKIELVTLEGKFGPELIKELSVKWKILPNFMFIGSPGDKFPYHVEELGGVRLII